MDFSLAFLQKSSLQSAANEILAANQASRRFELTLSPKEAEALAQRRGEALSSSGRVEFNCALVPQMIELFCDSKYLNQAEYAEVLGDLVEAFYYFKTEMLDRVDDQTLLRLMRDEFEECKGNMELLTGTALERAARRVREGLPPVPGDEELTQMLMEQEEEEDPMEQDDEDGEEEHHHEHGEHCGHAH